MSIIKRRHLDELETWLSTKETARILGLSRQGAQNLAHDGLVRAVHVGKHSESERGYWIFDPESVEAYKNQETRRRARRAVSDLDAGS